MPWVLVRYVFTTEQTRQIRYQDGAIYMWISSAIWVLSQILPNVPLSDQTDTTTMHTLGGVVAAVLFMYAVRVYKIRFETWWQPWIGLFLFASGLGILNELFEFFLQSVGWPDIVGGDEWWDLAANTFGAFVAYGLAVVIKFVKSVSPTHF